MHEMMFKRGGINLAKTPAWERRGIACYRTEIIKEGGYNPVTDERVAAARRVVVPDDDLPLFSEPEGGVAFLRSHLI